MSVWLRSGWRPMPRSTTLMRHAQDAGAELVMEAENQNWGYAGAFADPDGHMWQVGRADGFLTR